MDITHRYWYYFLTSILGQRILLQSQTWDPNLPSWYLSLCKGPSLLHWPGHSNTSRNSPSPSDFGCSTLGTSIPQQDGCTALATEQRGFITSSSMAIDISCLSDIPFCEHYLLQRHWNNWNCSHAQHVIQPILWSDVLHTQFIGKSLISLAGNVGFLNVKKNGWIDRHVCVGLTCCWHVSQHVGNTTKSGVSQGADNVEPTCCVRICRQHVGIITGT